MSQPDRLTDSKIRSADVHAGDGCGRSRAAGSRRCLRRSCRSSRRGASARPGTRGRSRSRRGSGSPRSVTHTAVSPAFSLDIEPSPCSNGLPLRAPSTRRATRAAGPRRSRVFMSASLNAMRLVLDDRPAELLALLGVVERVLVRGAGDADGLRADGGRVASNVAIAACTAAAPALAGAGEALVELLLAAEQAASRGRARRRGRPRRCATARMPCFLNFWPMRQARRARRHDEAGLARGALSSGSTDGDDHVDVGDAAVGDPRLGAVEHPLVLGLVVDGPGAQRAARRSRRRARSRRTRRAAIFVRRAEALRHPLARSARACRWRRCRRRARRGAEDRQADAGVTPEQLLHDDRPA